MRPYPSCVYWWLCAYMMEMIATSFFFAYCVSNFECWIYHGKDLHTAITDVVYCVRLVVCNRRVANKLRKGLDKALHKSYNTTPAEGGQSNSLLFAARLFWPHVYHSWAWVWPHMLVGVFLLCSRCFSSLVSIHFFLSVERFSSASTAPKAWPHINHSVLGFDHIFDHNQNRSTRRQECTRVWKSRFCVAERARKSKNG